MKRWNEHHVYSGQCSSQSGAIWGHRGHWTMSGHIPCCHNWGAGVCHRDQVGRGRRCCQAATLHGTVLPPPPPHPPPQNDLVQMTTVSQVSHPGLRKAGKEGERSHLICLHVTVTGLRGKEAEGDLQGELALGSEEGATSASQERWIHGFSAAGEKSRAAPPPTCSARACSRDTLTEQKPQIKVPPDGRPRWQLGKVEKPWLWTRAPQGQRKLITNRSSWARAAEQRTTERLVQTPSLVNCLRSLGSL